LPSAYLAWESETLPLRLDEAVDRLFALADGNITIDRLTARGPWRLTAMLDDRWLVLLGARDAGGAWTLVHLVHGLPPG
jgi:hypothetical protein